MVCNCKAIIVVSMVVLYMTGCCTHEFMFPEYGVDIEDSGYFVYDGLEFCFGPIRGGQEGFQVSCYKIIKDKKEWEDDDLLLPPIWHGLQLPHISPRCNITNETRFIPVRNTPYVLMMRLYDISTDVEAGGLTNGTVTFKLQKR